MATRWGLISSGQKFNGIGVRQGCERRRDQIRKRDRNRANAQKAYDALLKFLPRLSLTAAEAKELYSGAERYDWLLPRSRSHRFQTDPLPFIATPCRRYASRS